MSAPERIWAFAPDVFDNMSVWQDEPSPAGDTTEYIRADLTHTDADLERAVRAALEAAAEVCTSVIKNYDVMDASGQNYLPMKTQKAAKGMVSIAREDIRALDPSVKRGEGV
jgi:hypothetical protein